MCLARPLSSKHLSTCFWLHRHFGSVSSAHFPSCEQNVVGSGQSVFSVQLGYGSFGSSICMFKVGPSMINIVLAVAGLIVS